MSDTGLIAHLFVAQGRIEQVRYDAIVVPTDIDFVVEPQWLPLFGGRESAGRGGCKKALLSQPTSKRSIDP